MYKKKVLSFDHGTNSGWCLIDNGEYVDSGTFEVKDETNITFARYQRMISNMISHYRPDVVVIEKVNMQGAKFNAKAIFKLTVMQGIIRMVSAEHGLPTYEVNPMTLKKKLCDYGRAEKHEVASASSAFSGRDIDEICVPVLYKRGKKKGQIKTYIAEESDAIALGWYAVLTYNNSKGEM